MISASNRFFLAAWTAAFAFCVPSVAIANGAAASSPAAIAAEPAEPGGSLASGKQDYAAGRYTRARQHWERAAAAYATRGDRLGQLQSANYLALVYQKLGEWDAARAAVATGRQLLDADMPPGLQGQTHHAAASLSLATGNATAAIAAWEQAEARYQQADDRRGVLGSQLNRARALQQLGNLRRAERLLVAANAALAAEFPESLLQLHGSQALGSVRLARGDLKAAETTLEQALDLADRLAVTSEARSLHLALVGLSLATGDLEAASTHLAAAAELADSPPASIAVETARLQVQIARTAWSELPGTLATTQALLAVLPPGPARLDGTLAVAANLLRAPAPATTTLGTTLIPLLDSAAATATTLGDRRRLAQVRLLRARWYGRQGQPATARAELTAVLELAQALNAPEITAPAAWELGRTLAATGNNRPAAIAAYREAVVALKSLRGDLAATSRDAQLSFRRTVEPVYRELVSLLLADAPSQAELQEARETIEALRLAELDNFFRAACLDTRAVALESLDPQAAVIYPILLPDRLVAIVSRADAPLHHYTLPLPQAGVEAAIEALLASFHPAADNRERLNQSQTFYNWLVRPAEAQGWLAGIETLVFVLDGDLRQLPVAALFDGERYLVERYGIALSQGLQLLQPRTKAPSSRRRTLAAGLTQARGPFTALPGVARELEGLSATLPTSLLVDRSFTRSSLARLVAQRPADILHLATHGRFGSRPEETFLQAWDGPIDLRALEDLLLASAATRPETGIDLLVLSACQTAAGDDSAILGLAGLAVSSGARSTVATLWQVRDRSTARLMESFYEQLSDPANTKAAALQRAQLQLLRDPRYEHPFFWASFVLVGHWR